MFRDGQLDTEQLRALNTVVGREHLILGLSCWHREGRCWVVIDRWQRFTTMLDAQTLAELSSYCTGSLVHGVDVEGLPLGIEGSLVELLGAESPIPMTYAGIVRSFEDLNLMQQLGRGRVDVTLGSALDIFGGSMSYQVVVAW